MAAACQRGARALAAAGWWPWTPTRAGWSPLVNPANVLFRAYQPCSVFKIVVAIAGLTEGVITPETTVVCNKGCWMWPGHGPINLRRALAVSCNPYFEWVGEQLGYEKIQRYAQTLGLGAPSGINLTGETAGLLPTRVAPEAVGHLSSHAAGIATSAVQLAVLLSATINGGIVFQPQVAGPEDFAPKERWRLPAGHGAGRPRRRVLGRRQRGKRHERLRSGRRGRRQDGNLREPWLVRVVRSGRPPQAGARGLHAPGQRPLGVGGGRSDLPGDLQAVAAAPDPRRGLGSLIQDRLEALGSTRTDLDLALEGRESGSHDLDAVHSRRHLQRAQLPAGSPKLAVHVDRRIGGPHGELQGAARSRPAASSRSGE